MGHVSVFINGRSYRLGCEDGEEHRVHELARYVSAKIDELTREIGPAGGERLYVMVALMLADEVLEMRDGLSQAVEQHVETLKAVAPPAQVAAPIPDPVPALAAPAKQPKIRGSVQVPGAERGPPKVQRG